MEYELMHYGVKGMKWGVRKKRAVADGLVRRAVVGAGVPNSYGGGSKHQLSRAKKDLDILDNGGHLSIGITKKRQAAFDARDRANLEKKISSLEAKEKAKIEKKARKQAIKDTYKEVNKQASFGEKLIYNNATRKLAAKYVVDNNMSVADAKKKANSVAMRNTAIFIGAYGAITVASIVSSK